MIHTLLKNKKIILASKSPRRKEILMMLGLKPLQIAALIKEESNFKQPGKYVVDLALKKAVYVASQMDEKCFVIGSDTVVYHNNKILEKPKDIYEAEELLKNLSDSVHTVYSSVAICFDKKKFKNFSKTKVNFRKLSEKEIKEYINTKEPMDKAGAYGIQGQGAQFIKSIQGDYFTVMGFPVSLFYSMIKKIF